MPADPAPFLQAVERHTATAPSLQRGTLGWHAPFSDQQGSTSIMPSDLRLFWLPDNCTSATLEHLWKSGGFKEKQTKKIFSLKPTGLQRVKPATGLHFGITKPLKSAPFFPPAQFAKRTGINTSLRFTKGLSSWLPRDFSGKADT